MDEWLGRGHKWINGWMGEQKSGYMSIPHTKINPLFSNSSTLKQWSLGNGTITNLALYVIKVYSD